MSAASAMIRGSAASPGSAAKLISAEAWSERRAEQHERLALEVDQPAQHGSDEAERERVGGRRGAAGRERAGDLVRAQDEDEADRAHRQPADQRGRERRGGARRAQRREEPAAGGGGDGHRCQCRPERPRSQKRFGELRIFGDTAGVIVYRFGREDLLHTRFAISPLFELQASVSAAARPRRALRAPAVGARGARAARGLRLRDARRAAPRARLRARLLRAAAALAAARRRRGARARARHRPGADAAQGA